MAADPASIPPSHSTDWANPRTRLHSERRTRVLILAAAGLIVVRGTWRTTSARPPGARPTRDRVTFLALRGGAIDRRVRAARSRPRQRKKSSRLRVAGNGPGGGGALPRAHAFEPVLPTDKSRWSTADEALSCNVLAGIDLGQPSASTSADPRRSRRSLSVSNRVRAAFGGLFRRGPQILPRRPTSCSGRPAKAVSKLPASPRSSRSTLIVTPDFDCNGKARSGLACARHPSRQDTSLGFAVGNTDLRVELYPLGFRWSNTRGFSFRRLLWPRVPVAPHLQIRFSHLDTRSSRSAADLFKRRAALARYRRPTIGLSGIRRSSGVSPDSAFELEIQAQRAMRAPSYVTWGLRGRQAIGAAIERRADLRRRLPSRST